MEDLVRSQLIGANRRLTLPSRGRFPAYGLQAPLMSNVRRHMPRSRRNVLLLPVLLAAMPATSQPSFRREASVNLRNVGRESSALVSPSALVRAFGSPTDEPWDSESLGGYYFVSSEQLPFTVYYRAYDHSSVAIARIKKTFWSQPSTVEFSIGARGQSGVAEFTAWLLSALTK